ncbi:MAG: hypothetical protein ABIQ99_17410 [Thermoflexales bacterium]
MRSPLADGQTAAVERPAIPFGLQHVALSPLGQSLPTQGGTPHARVAPFGPDTLDADFSDSVAGITTTLIATNTPDIVGDIGPRYYVQAGAGTVFAVFDRAGLLLSGPSLVRDLWPPGNCHSNDRGHPGVMWDPLTDRWFLTHQGNGNFICIAVSATADPRGSYHLYDFDTGIQVEAHEIGAWRDALLISISGPQSWIFALEKASMIEGGNARAFGGYAAESGAGYPVPVSFSGGPLPPAGQPPLFVSRLTPGTTRPSGRFALSRLKVDWNSNTATIAEVWSANGADVGAPASFRCDNSPTGCIPQPGTSVELFAQDPPIRAVARYRRFDGAQRVVAAISAPTGLPARPQVIWFELSAPWTRQVWSLTGSGASVAGTESRWLGAAAINSAQEIGLGYSTSSNVISPSLRFALWPRTEMTPAAASESGLWTGSGAQIIGNVWNDRAGVSVDPADGCTFWETGAYLDASGSSAWHTRVGRFRSSECEPVTYALRVWPDTANACVETPLALLVYADPMAATAPITLNVAPITPTTFVTIQFSQPPVALIVPLSVPVTVMFPVTTPLGLYLLGVNGSGSGLFTATAEITLWRPITDGPTLNPATVSPVPYGVAPAGPGPASTAFITYGLTFQWSLFPNTVSYFLEVASDAGFSTVVFSRTTAFNLEFTLAQLQPLSTYFWRVRMVNPCGFGPASEGTFQTPVFMWLPILRR